MQEGLRHLADRDVSAQVRRLIAEGELQPGQRLPPERVLAERLKVNRGTLRKALTRLEIEGLITRQVGRGTFVGLPQASTAEVAQIASPMELLDARAAMEPVIAKEAALRARREHVERLGLCIARSEESDVFETFEEWDIAFHRALAEATQNPILIMIMDVMRQMRMQEDWNRLKRASFSSTRLETYRRQHREILTAVKQRDPIAAAEAMSAHIRLIRTGLDG